VADKQPADPKKVPIGSGLADRAKQTISGRQKQIDDAVDAMASGDTPEDVLANRKRAQHADHMNGY
jgi:hypothetical protein